MVIEGEIFYKIRISPELMKSLFVRDQDCNKIDIEWGEPDEEGFYTPIFYINYEDNPLNETPN